MADLVNYQGFLFEIEVDENDEEFYSLALFDSGDYSNRIIKLRSGSGQLKAVAGDLIRVTVSKTEELVEDLAVHLEKIKEPVFVHKKGESFLVYSEKNKVINVSDCLAPAIILHDKLGFILDTHHLIPKARKVYKSLTFKIVPRGKTFHVKLLECIEEVKVEDKLEELEIEDDNQEPILEENNDLNLELIHVLRDCMNDETPIPERKKFRSGSNLAGIQKAVSLANQGKKRVVVIEGGPQSGKTHVLAEYIAILLSLKMSAVVLCATRKALLNVKKAAEDFLDSRLDPETIMDFSTFDIRQKEARNCVRYRRETQLWENAVNVGFPSEEKFRAGYVEHCQRLDKIIMENVCEKVKIVFATMNCSFVQKMSLSGHFKPEECLIDAANQVLETQPWYDCYSSIKRFIIAGDPNQLSAMSFEQEDKYESKTSLMDHVLMKKEKCDYVMLTECFVVKEILDWSNETFYDNKLTSVTMNPNPKTFYPRSRNYLQPMMFFDTRLEEDRDAQPRYFEKKIEWSDQLVNQTNGQPQRHREHAFINEGEAQIVINHTADLVSVGYERESIAVITPYKAQVELLSRMLLEKDFGDVQVGTVDQFQGQQFKAVIFSMVRYNPARRLGCFADLRRLNVAITRAKLHFCFVGNIFMLNHRKFPDLQNLITKFKSRNSPSFTRREVGHPLMSLRIFQSTGGTFGHDFEIFEKHTTDQNMLDWINYQRRNKLVKNQSKSS